jgi:hypothetical protein
MCVIPFKSKCPGSVGGRGGKEAERIKTFGPLSGMELQAEKDR